MQTPRIMVMHHNTIFHCLVIYIEFIAWTEMENDYILEKVKAVPRQGITIFVNLIMNLILAIYSKMLHLSSCFEIT